MDTFDDLLVRVQRKELTGPETQTYIVELWLQSGQRLNERTEVSLGDYLAPSDHDPVGMATNGLDLFNRLFNGALAVAFQQAWAAANARGRILRVRLALDAKAPLLHAIPWELLYFDASGGSSPPHPLATDPQIAFSRYIESDTFNEGQPTAERPIRMLLGIASPKDLAQWQLASLDRAAEERDFRTRFSAAVASGQFGCDVLPNATKEGFQTALTHGALEGEDNRERGYDALLYYGHALYAAKEGTALVLEDATSGLVQLYDSEVLLTFLQQLPASHRPALVILVACNSATTGALNSLATRLMLESGIPAVIAMQRLVEVTLARTFTHSLTEHLLRDGVIDMAMSVARRRVFQRDRLGWSTPVLYMRNPTGRLFSPNAQLEYVTSILRDPGFVRWAGPEFIDVGVLTLAPGQDWNLLRFRPEDAPAATSAVEAITRALALEPRPTRRRAAQERQQSSNFAALIGPPQSGQTTLLLHLTCQLAEAVTRDATRPLGIFISLTGYEQLRGQNRLERQCIEQARTVAPALAERLAELFRPDVSRQPTDAAPRFVFLFDNYDALPERARHDLGHDLTALAQRLPRERFLITATQDNFPATIFAAALVFVIQPLGEQQILNYLRQRDAPNALHLYYLIRENRLLDLASDPSLLGLITERLASNPQARLTRNQLMQDYLDRMLGELDPRYSLGDAARESLLALAWQSRWNHREQLPLDEVFRILGQVRRERDYSLEDLYDRLREVRLLLGVGQHAARFVNPTLHAYCAAVALTTQPASAERLADIVALCASAERLSWWEDVLYALADLMADPTPLFERLAAAIRGGSSTHTLLAARCLEALSLEQEARLAGALRAELIDACLLRLRIEREPLAERREQFVAALGRLNYAEVCHALQRILVEKVRLSSSGPRYEYTNVRIAAARALRNIYQATAPETSAVTSAQVAPDEAMLERSINIWRKGPAGREEFRDLLRTSRSAPERALAAFALGDLTDTPSNKLRDAKHLLRVILSPLDRTAQTEIADWQDTMWAAADALTLFDPALVTPLLTVMVSRNKTIPDNAVQPLAYLAGRVRATNQPIIDWLIRLLVSNPDLAVKAKALQSLAWMGIDFANMRLKLKDGHPRATLKLIMQDIAAARQVRGLSQDDLMLKLPTDEAGGDEIYLRRKALEALAWIGDSATLKDLGALCGHWPIELREAWYLAAATITGRLGRARA